MRMKWAGLAAAFFLLAISSHAIASPEPSTELTQLDSLVDSMCGKSIVLLGEEGHHAAGRSIEIKTAMLERLVDRCGFSALFFESDIYEFLDLERASERGKATRAQLADAIGGLWSPTAESDPLTDYLLARLNKGKLRIGGIDAQLGGATQLYTQRGLAADLARPLSEPQRKACETAIERLAQWKYERDGEYQSERPILAACARASEAAFAKRRGADNERLRRMAVNLRYFVDFPDGDVFNARDHALYENLVWQLHRLRAGTKVIVWCASVHAAHKSSSDNHHPMGEFLHHDFGSRLAVVAVDALEGSYGRQSPESIKSAQDSLEATLFAQETGDIRIATGASLNAVADRPAHFMNFGKSVTAHWSDFVEAIVIVRTEQPPRYVREVRPQRIWPDAAGAGSVKR